MPDPINPPAIVRSATRTLAQRAAAIKAMHKAHVKSALENAIALGGELQAAKDQCQAEGKPWPEFLREASYSRTTAHRNLRAFANRDKFMDESGRLCSTVEHLGVVEALNWLAGPDEPEQPASTPAVTGNPASANGISPPPTLCSQCARNLRVGKPVRPHCPDCKALREPPAPREPGDDTQAEAEFKRAERASKRAEPKSGEPVVTTAEVTRWIGMAMHGLDNLARGLGMVGTARPGFVAPIIPTPEYSGLLRRMEEAKSILEGIIKDAVKFKKHQTNGATP